MLGYLVFLGAIGSTAGLMLFMYLWDVGRMTLVAAAILAISAGILVTSLLAMLSQENPPVLAPRTYYEICTKYWDRALSRVVDKDCPTVGPSSPKEVR